MTKNLRSLAAFYWERRWSMALLSLAAGLFAAPYLYWNSILMRIVMNAAHATDLLLGLNLLNALGGALLLALAALGIGGCLSAMRAELDGAGVSLPRAIFGGLRRCARCSLAAGALLGFSLGMLRMGLVALHALLPTGTARTSLSALLILQFLLVLPLCLLSVCQADALQAKPARAFKTAWRRLLPNLGQYWLFTVATLLPLLLLFVWQKPVMTLLGFLAVVLVAFAPLMLLWLRHRDGFGATTRLHSGALRVGTALLGAGLLVCAGLALALPLLRQGRSPSLAVQAPLLETVRFVLRLTVQDADNGTIRDLLSDSSVWLMLTVGLLGSACCVLVTYFCACYRFRRRKLLFSFTVLLQMLPLLANFSAIDQLLHNLGLPDHPVLLGILWSLLYICAAVLLYRRFSSMKGKIEVRRAAGEGEWRPFFYYALPRARLHVIAIAALVSFGCWNDALAPFWYMQRLGAFSVGGYVWQQTTPEERVAYLGAFAAAILLFLLLSFLSQSHRKKASGANEK